MPDEKEFYGHAIPGKAVRIKPDEKFTCRIDFSRFTDEQWEQFFGALMLKRIPKMFARLDALVEQLDGDSGPQAGASTALGIVKEELGLVDPAYDGGPV